MPAWWQETEKRHWRGNGVRCAGGRHVVGGECGRQHARASGQSIGPMRFLDRGRWGWWVQGEGPRGQCDVDDVSPVPWISSPSLREWGIGRAPCHRARRRPGSLALPEGVASGCDSPGPCSGGAMMRRGRQDVTPLLLRMARPQTRSVGEPTRYDPELDELLVRTAGRWVPAIDLPTGGPRTKKADVETGEDQKDRW